ncbi:hypothetical protein D8L93_00805 [Sodalis-like symbiont of Bactericera trigonica]|nr:hypothetical protein D8L93_00805 [Sodalis-like symbiont of Bactericera trigonica]
MTTAVALAAADLRGSLLHYDNQLTLHYLAWGEQHLTAPADDAGTNLLPGYLPRWQGEILDAPSGGYSFGNGYQLYRRDIQGFTTLDTLRPGGISGMNRYL